MPERSRVKKAIIPAAGLGTRMLPASKAIPKEMLPVAGKPLIEYSVEEAAASGIETVILVVREDNSLIQEHFATDPALEKLLEGRQRVSTVEQLRRLATLVDLRYVEQERPQGLAQALCCARQLVGHEPFAVLLPDVIILSEQPVTRQLMCMNERYGGSFIAIREVAACDVERHGIVELDGSVPAESPKGARITRLVEKPARHSARSALGIFGRYVLEPSIWNAIAQTKLDGRGEVQLTDALNLFCQRESLAGVCFQGRHYDAGDPLGYLKVNIELSLESAELRPLLLKYLSGIVDNGDRNAREVLPENADVKKGGNPPT